MIWQLTIYCTDDEYGSFSVLPHCISQLIKFYFTMCYHILSTQWNPCYSSPPIWVSTLTKLSNIYRLVFGFTLYILWTEKKLISKLVLTSIEGNEIRQRYHLFLVSYVFLNHLFFWVTWWKTAAEKHQSNIKNDVFFFKTKHYLTIVDTWFEYGVSV